VRDADDFPAVLARLAPRLHGRTVLAHNASFDISVIRNTCDLYGLAYPEFDYLCTVKLAQRSWPDLASHKLNAVCAHLGVAFKHHDAGEDAYACATLALEAMKVVGASCFDSLCALTDVAMGRLSADSYRPCSAPKPKAFRPRPTPPRPDVVLSDRSAASLAGLSFVFTGALERFTRSEARSRIESLGGEVSGSVSKTTDYVVAGPGAGARLAAAQKHGVKVLTEDQWLALVGQGVNPNRV